MSYSVIFTTRGCVSLALNNYPNVSSSLIMDIKVGVCLKARASMPERFILFGIVWGFVGLMGHHANLVGVSSFSRGLVLVSPTCCNLKTH